MTENNNPSTTPASKPAEEPTSGRRRPIIFVAIGLIVVAVAIFWYISSLSEDTDDAQISGHLIQVSSRVTGQVIKVDVEENQFVQAGTVVAELDPRDYQVAVEQAEANLASAQAAAAAASVNVPLTQVNTGSNLHSASAEVSGSMASVQQAIRQLEAAQARVAVAEANNNKAQADLARYTPLVQKDVISKQQYDAAVASAEGAKASLVDAQANQQAAQQGVQVARDRAAQAESNLKYAETAPKQVEVQNARARQAQAQVEQAQASLDQAKLNLSYTKITTPVAGIVTRKSIELNQNVSVGGNLMTLVSLDDLWVTANFKETQLKHMHAGQEVTVKVDATGRKYKGKVTQIGGATGSVLSLFPPENATGNYVKVVQRIPVRIDFTDKNENSDHLLRPGMSVIPKVDIKD